MGPNKTKMVPGRVDRDFAYHAGRLLKCHPTDLRSLPRQQEIELESTPNMTYEPSLRSLYISRKGKTGTRLP